MVADFETNRLRERTQSRVAVINVLESKTLKIRKGQTDLLDCMQCFSFTFFDRKILEEKYIPKDEVSGYNEDCKTAGHGLPCHHGHHWGSLQVYLPSSDEVLMVLGP